MPPIAATASSRSCGSAFGVRDQLHRARAPPPDRRAGRARGSPRRRRARSRSVNERQQHRDGAPILESPRGPWPRTRACTDADPSRASAARAAPADPRAAASAKATGHQRTRGCRAVEHRRSQRVVGLEPDQRVHRQPKRAAGVSRAASASGAGGLSHGTRLNDVGRHLPDRLGRRSIADQAQRFGGAALDERRRIAQARRPADRARDGSPIRPSANAAICRTSGSGSASSATSGGTPSRQPDAADRQRRAAANARVAVAEQPHQIGRRRRRRRRDDRRLLAFDGRRPEAGAGGAGSRSTR